MNFFHPMNIKTRRLISSEDLKRDFDHKKCDVEKEQSDATMAWRRVRATRRRDAL